MISLFPGQIDWLRKGLENASQSQKISSQRKWIINQERTIMQLQSQPNIGEFTWVLLCSVDFSASEMPQHGLNIHSLNTILDINTTDVFAAKQNNLSLSMGRGKVEFLDVLFYTNASNLVPPPSPSARPRLSEPLLRISLARAAPAARGEAVRSSPPSRWSSWCHGVRASEVVDLVKLQKMLVPLYNNGR